MGLQTRPDLNGGAIKLGAKGDDGRWEGHILPYGREIVRLKTDNMLYSTEKGIMCLYTHELVINGIAYSVNGTRQGKKTPLIIVRYRDERIQRGKAQFGMVNCGKVGSLHAFKIAVAILTLMESGTLPCTKEAFTARRDFELAQFVDDHV